MARIECLIGFLKENDNITIIADKFTLINTLFEYATERTILTVGRYNENEEFLMISKLGKDIIVESILGYQDEVYYVDANKVIMTKEALEFVIARQSLDRIIDECEEFQVI